MKKGKQIKVCEFCSKPLIWTFLYAGAEYYCLDCSGRWGMLGAGEDVDVTTKLRAESKVYNDVFKSIEKHYFGTGSFTKKNCEKCKSGNDRCHTQHATEYEKEKSLVAHELLQRNFIGIELDKEYFEIAKKRITNPVKVSE